MAPVPHGVDAFTCPPSLGSWAHEFCPIGMLRDAVGSQVRTCSKGRAWVGDVAARELCEGASSRQNRIVDTIYLKGSGKMATQLCQKCCAERIGVQEVARPYNEPY